MYINDVHIAFYAVAVILSIFIGQLVDWANKRMPEYKKVFSKEIFEEYKAKFKPNYILMLIIAVIYVALIYVIRNKKYINCKFRLNKIYNNSTNVTISICNRL